MYVLNGIRKECSFLQNTQASSTDDNFLSLQANMLSLDTRNKYRVTKVRNLEATGSG